MLIKEISIYIPYILQELVYIIDIYNKFTRRTLAELKSTQASHVWDMKNPLCQVMNKIFLFNILANNKINAT